VGLDSSVGLIVATLDLQMVRLVRAAMAGGGAGKHPDGPIHPAPKFEPRKRIEPEPVIEPRRRIEPEPRFDPRPKLRPYDVQPPCCAPCDSAIATEPAEKASRSTSPIEPPWKVLPWENPPEPAPRVVRKIKVFLTPPDMHSKGSVIDLFI
jgi:hypothetical protein